MNDEEKKDKEEQEYQKKFNALPEDLKRVFASDEVTDNILTVGKAHGLTIDKVGELGDETGLVMLGITKTVDFIKNLSERLGVDKEKAKAVAEDINQKVFQQIRASLKKVHGIPEAPPSSNPPGKKSDFPGKSDFKEGGFVPGRALPAPVAEIPKAPVALRPGEIEPSSQIFAKKIVPIDELLDKIDSDESIIKPKIKIESVPVNLPVEEKITTQPSGILYHPGGEAPPPLLVKEGIEPSEAPLLSKEGVGGGNKVSEANLTPDEIKSAVEKALGGKITTKDTNDPYREPTE